MQSAADVDALRRALKINNVVLFGISYGTRLALTVMNLYPDNIYTAILDSVVPPQSGHSFSDSKIFGAVFDRLFQACQLSWRPRCRNDSRTNGSGRRDT